MKLSIQNFIVLITVLLFIQSVSIAKAAPPESEPPAVVESTESEKETAEETTDETTESTTEETIEATIESTTEAITEAAREETAGVQDTYGLQKSGEPGYKQCESHVCYVFRL